MKINKPVNYRVSQLKDIDNIQVGQCYYIDKGGNVPEKKVFTKYDIKLELLNYHRQGVLRFPTFKKRSLNIKK